MNQTLSATSGQTFDTSTHKNVSYTEINAVGTTSRPTVKITDIYTNGYIYLTYIASFQ